MEVIIKDVVDIVKPTGLVLAASKIKEDSLLGLLYKDTLQPSVQSLGVALGNIMEFCTTPFLLCKFGSEVAKENFKKHLDNYAKKLESIPENEKIHVNPQIGVPLLDRLTYTTNDEIAELFIKLLTRASATSTVNSAHPAFIQIIDRLTPDEAKILVYLQDKKHVPFVGLESKEQSARQYHPVRNHQTCLSFDLLLDFPENVPTYIDNLESVGVLELQSTIVLTDTKIYDRLYEIYKYDDLEDDVKQQLAFTDMKRLKGTFKVTDFGQLFIVACTR